MFMRTKQWCSPVTSWPKRSAQSKGSSSFPQGQLKKASMASQESSRLYLQSKGQNLPGHNCFRAGSSGTFHRPAPRATSGGTLVFWQRGPQLQPWFKQDQAPLMQVTEISGIHTVLILQVYRMLEL
jgi:hypothetical protein